MLDFINSVEPMTQQEVEPRVWLLNEFSNRRLKNPKYSLRSFAKTLGVSPSRLSDIFNQKRNMTLNQAVQFTERLSIPPEMKKNVLSSFDGGKNKKTLNLNHTYQRISNDIFYLLRDWQHFAILNLIETKNFKSDPQWIAKRLGIQVLDVNLSLERLKRCELIEIKNKKIKATHKNISTSDQSVNHALRHAHRDTLEQAILAIDEVDIKWRDISSMVVPVNIDKITEAKKLIKSFRRKLAEVLESGNKTEVYNLNIQLVPVTKIGDVK